MTCRRQLRSRCLVGPGGPVTGLLRAKLDRARLRVTDGHGGVGSESESEDGGSATVSLSLSPFARAPRRGPRARHRAQGARPGLSQAQLVRLGEVTVTVGSQ